MYSYKEAAILNKALSDETRLKIIDMLSCKELCACEILAAFDIAQPTLSYHLKILSECNLLLSRRSGAWIYYSLNNDTFSDLKNFLNHVSTAKEDCICHQYARNKKKSAEKCRC